MIRRQGALVAKTAEEEESGGIMKARVPMAEFMTSNIGRWVYGDPVVVDRERAIAFSEAINDPLGARVHGAAVTPMFSVLPIYTCLFDAVDLVTPDQLRPTVLHGAHDIHFEAPVREGSTLQARAHVIGVHAVSIGTAVTVRIEVVDENGASVSTQLATALVRGAATVRDEGLGSQDASLRGESGLDSGAESVRVVSALRADQTSRFAQVSGDMHAVHLDDEVARGLGFDGTILHGLCTLGIACGAVVQVCCDSDPAHLRRLAVRFAAPAYPRGELTTEVSPLDGGRYGFVTTESSGGAVLKNGLVLTGRA
jgi:acyl dehydratase